MNSKIWLIFKREYFNIVKKKTFLISTFLLPLGMAAIFGIQILATIFVEKEEYTVLYQTGPTAEIANYLKDDDMFTYQAVDLPFDSLKARVEANEKEVFISFPQAILEKQAGTAVVYSAKNLSAQSLKGLRRDARDAVRSYKEDRAGISPEQLAATEFDLEVQNQRLVGDQTVANNALMAMIMGYAVCFLMYFLMGIYGSILMQGVIEEKSNRIVEVIVSSVKPFQLLLGKVIAIASVGITQFLLWIGLSGLVLFGMSLIVAATVDPSSMAQAGQAGAEVDANQIAEILTAIQTFNWSVLWFFPFYFLGGFFLYGSLMAGAGSTVDNIQDAQQFTTPVTILLILPLIFLPNIIQNPNGNFALFASVFPFFSPMAMLVRMSLTEVPWYQSVISLALLLATFLGCIWLAAKIYRTGILMYGKKPSFKEVFRWVRR